MRDIGLQIQTFRSDTNRFFFSLISSGPRHLNPTRCLKKNQFRFKLVHFGSGSIQVHNLNTCKIHVIWVPMSRINSGIQDKKILKLSRKNQNTKNTRKSNKYPKIFKYSKNSKFYSNLTRRTKNIYKFLSEYPKYILKILKFYLKLETITENVEP